MELRNITKVVEGKYNADSLPCPQCNTVLTVEVEGANVFKYHQGYGIVDVLGHLSADERERFISGYCGDCWDALFPDDDDEEEEY